MREHFGKGVVLALFGLLLGLTLILSITLPILPIASANISFAENQSARVITRVNVSNSPPFVSNLTINYPVNLVPNSTFNLSCNATVLDYNNWSDIAYVNFTFFSTNISTNDAPDANRSHYSMWNCTSSVEENQFTRRYNCAAQINYNAFFNNWTCNITAADRSGVKDDEIITTTINDLISFAVPDELDFGDVPVLNTSVNVHLNTTNVGNQPINFSAFAYAREEGDGAVMLCNFGNITSGSLRYSANISDINSPIDFATMDSVANTNATASSLGVIAHPFNTSTSNALNGSTWRLNVPLGPGGTPSGLCNGSLILRAEKAFNSVD